MYRLATEVDRRYGPCPSNANRTGMPRQTDHGALPPQSAVQSAIQSATQSATARLAPQGAARRPGTPVTPLPTGVTPMPPRRSTRPPTEGGVWLPVPRINTTGTFGAVPGAPRVPTALSARHDELRARREQHRARRDELRARRGGGDRSRDGGRHDLGRPVDASSPLTSRIPGGSLPQPKSELIDVLEDVLRWSH
jgi:hypothetical protein